MVNIADMGGRKLSDICFCLELMPMFSLLISFDGSLFLAV